MSHRTKALSGKLSSTLVLVLALHQVTLSQAQEIRLEQGLVLGRVGSAGRNPFHTSALEKQWVLGPWALPSAGDNVAVSPGTNVTWKTALASSDGVFSGAELAGGYLFIPVVAEQPGVKILEAAGHGMVSVNGEPRVGDPYFNESLQVPVMLQPGTNSFLFSGGRGRVKAKLTDPKAPLFFNLRDSTLPDLVRGAGEALWGAIVVVNATTNAWNNLSIVTALAGEKSERTTLPSIPPLTCRKVPFKIPLVLKPATNTLEYSLSLHGQSGQKQEEAGVLDTAKIALRVREAWEHYKVTFTSEIDGSLQYFAVTPARPLSPEEPARALFLSTHGAGVEAIGQAAAYNSKSWGNLVAPSNRRPYGFDWEDWGRRDGLEVLDLAMARFKSDPRQVYLTGHSMGGHGTWQLGVTFPDRFAALAPSAGWISFFSYAGTRRQESPNPVQALLQRATNPSDTLALSSNYLQHGIYILHGDADDNVPVSEARTMKEHLSGFHRDFTYHEQPGAGHWWGNDCVDWAPIFELFARHRIPNSSQITFVQFATANPGISASCHWLSIEAQEKALARSSVAIRFHAGSTTFRGTTENVASLNLQVDALTTNRTITVELDGEKLQVERAQGQGRIWLEHRDKQWQTGQERARSMKGPHRNGPFKEAFGHRMLFVYATHGSLAENAWAYAKARFDAETWWYRGNGAVDLVADSAFDPAREPDRGVVLYGHAENNSAWAGLLGSSPVQVQRGSIRVGAREIKGDDLSALFCRPRPGSDIASVAVISGTGLAGMRLVERVPYFMGGVAFPDCTIFGADTLSQGSAGARVAGYFGNDWTVENGEFAWKE